MKTKELLNKIGTVRLKKWHVDSVGIMGAIIIEVNNKAFNENTNQKIASNIVCQRVAKTIFNNKNYKLV